MPVHSFLIARSHKATLDPLGGAGVWFREGRWNGFGLELLWGE